jgi:hypothetical protein
MRTALKVLVRGLLLVATVGNVAIGDFLFAPKEGIYEFPDQTAGGKPYVGQSENMPQRLGQHEATGRLEPGTETTTEVPGGKTAREVAEHNRIQELTEGQRAANSDAAANQRDPIGLNRRPGLGIPGSYGDRYHNCRVPYVLGTHYLIIDREVASI